MQVLEWFIPESRTFHSDLCIFCGACCSSGATSDSNKRTKRKVEIAQFVKDWCKPTPFLYPVLSNLSGSERMNLCIPCINWYRRCSQGMRKRSGGQKQLLRVDQLILYLIEPGSVLKPDQRCLWRLLRTLKGSEQEGIRLPWMDVVPLPVQIMLTNVDANRILSFDQQVDRSIPELLRRSTSQGHIVFDELLKVWWEYHGKTRFFTHQGTAKLMRKWVKDYVESGSSSSGGGLCSEIGFAEEDTSELALLAQLSAIESGAAGEGVIEEGMPESASATQSDANWTSDTNFSQSLDI